MPRNPDNPRQFRTRAAIYTRISTDKQEHQNQLRQLRAFCHRQNWRIVAEYTDTDSGTTATAKRKAWRQLMTAAARKEFTAVVWWDLARVTREGVAATFAALEQLRAAGIDYYDYSNPEVRSAGPQGELFVSIAAIFNRMERDRISQRTRAGLERAKAGGTTLGRPRRLVDASRLQQLAAQDLSASEIARRLKLSRKTVARRLAELPEAGTVNKRRRPTDKAS